MCSRTIRSASGEDGPTHQPVEQLVALRSIPGLITLRPADANEVVEAWRVVMRAEASARLSGVKPPAAPDLRPHALCAGRRRRAGRLCPGRCGGRQAGGDLDRHRQRSRAVCRGLRDADAGRHRGARRQHAVLGVVRTAGSGLSRQRAAARRRQRGCRSSRVRSSAGIATSAAAAPRSACTPSARRRRSRIY